MKISLLRASRLAKVALLKAERRRAKERMLVAAQADGVVENHYRESPNAVMKRQIT